MEKPKNLHNQNMSFQTAVNSGKNVSRVTSDSVAGKRMMNTKGSVNAEDEAFMAMEAKLNKKASGCGAKEMARRAKQLKNFQHSIDAISPTQRTMEAEKRMATLKEENAKR